MLCYKEVHKYNNKYYSRFDNGFEFKLGSVTKPSGDDFIYATNTISNVLQYAYVPFDMAILEMEIVEGTEWHQRDNVIVAKEVNIIREVPKDEYYNSRIQEDNRSTGTVSKDRNNSVLFDLLQERRRCLLSKM